MTIVYVLLAIVAVLLLWLVFTYNRLVTFVNRTKESWSDIDVQLKRRYDLIPNLVEAVKGYAAHEREAFEKVTAARAQAIGAQSVQEKAEAENQLSGALKSLFAVAEAYPQLRAVESFTKLQDELADTENKIQAARRFYNTNVRDLNTSLQVFPTTVIANSFGFRSQDFFDLEGAPAEREPVKVSF